MTETTSQILEVLEDTASGRLLLRELASPPYSEDALAEARDAFRDFCRVSGRGAAGTFSVEIEVLPEVADRSRAVVSEFLEHFLDLSIRKFFQCR